MYVFLMTLITRNNLEQSVIIWQHRAMLLTQFEAESIFLSLVGQHMVQQSNLRMIHKHLLHFVKIFSEGN
jgi:hypothetical protein